MARFCPECGGKKIVDLKDTIFCEKCGIFLRNDFHASTHSFINNFFKNDPNSKGNVIKGGKKNEIDIQKGTAHIFTIKKNEQDLEKIKEYLKQVNWHEISDDWEIQVYKGRGYKTITLNPYQDCSESNPLYMHKKWLEWVYTNEELNLSDQSIAEICGFINNKTIGNWRAKFNIPTKASDRYIKSGYVFLHMPKEYKHPELNLIGDKRFYRGEHIVVMEEHLNKTLTQEELSRHPCLIKNDGRSYIKLGSVVHHKNHIRLDNRIENLWLYKDRSEHHNSNINMCLSGLIKINQILFSNGRYYLNRDDDYRYLTLEEINDIIKPVEFVNYEDMDFVRNTIKNMDWSGMDWNIEYQIRNNAPIEKVILNPYEDCSEENPLYRNRRWFERIVLDKRFNLTDQRLSKLCGISESSVRRWRWERYGIPAEFWGFIRRLGLSSSGKKIILMKVPKSYGNPFAVKKVNFDQMREHRYIMEQHLAREPELNQKYLFNGKYLKPKCKVHHINLDKLDNRLENLYLCKDTFEHNTVHFSLIKLIDELLRLGLMVFENGKYFLAYPWKSNRKRYH